MQRNANIIYKILGFRCLQASYGTEKITDLNRKFELSGVIGGIAVQSWRIRTRSEFRSENLP